MSSEAPISRPSDGDSPHSERSDQALEKRVTFTSDTQVESSLTTADAPKSSESTKRNSNHSRRHLVYAIKLTEEGIKEGWQIEHMLEGRTMPELLDIPDGQVLITNGAATGFAAIEQVPDSAGKANCDHAVPTPSIYSPDLPLGKRISNAGMPTSEVPRV